MRRKVLNAICAGLCTISCALLIAALVITYWFGTAQKIATRDRSDPTVTYEAEYDVKLSPFKVRWLVVLRAYRLGAVIQTTTEVDYDGPLGDICTIKRISDQINSADTCDKVKQGGMAVGAVAIAACALCGFTAIICVIAVFTDNCRNKCCVCLITLAVDVTFLAVLIVAALWGALAILGKGTINEQVPKFTNSFLPSSAEPVTEKGTFAPQIALWLSVAAVGPCFLALFVNWIACCCASNDKDMRNRRIEPTTTTPGGIPHGAPQFSTAPPTVAYPQMQPPPPPYNAQRPDVEMATKYP